MTAQSNKDTGADSRCTGGHCDSRSAAKTERRAAPYRRAIPNTAPSSTLKLDIVRAPTEPNQRNVSTHKPGCARTLISRKDEGGEPDDSTFRREISENFVFSRQPYQASSRCFRGLAFGCRFALPPIERPRRNGPRRRTHVELHKSYIALGLIIAFVLFFGIAARANESASIPKSGMLVIHQDRPAMRLLRLAAEPNGIGRSIEHDYLPWRAS
jgi:hypothetical protein